MLQPIQLALVLVALVVGLRAVFFILVLHNTLRIRLRPPQLERIAEVDVPAHVREGLRGPIAELRELGFEFAGWISLLRMDRLSTGGCAEAWLFHPGTAAHASVGFTPTPDSLNLYAVTFRSFGADGHILQTVNGVAHSFVPVPPNHIVVDPYAPSIAGQWQAHIDAVRQRRFGPEKLDADRAIERADEMARKTFEALVADGLAVPAGDAFLLTWGAAVRLAAQATRGQQRVKKLRASRLKMQRGSAPLPPLQEEVLAYERMDELRRAPSRRSFYLWMFAATLVLLGLSLTSRSTSTWAAALLGALLLHESGHYIAMRALGYQDTTIFFVPFMGGMATGRKDDATLAEEIVVLFAGPVPGLALAAGVALAGGQRFPVVATVLLALAALNLFNLLPFLPLDGGRIAHALFFERSASLALISRVTAVVGFALFSWATSSTVATVLAVLMLFGIPQGRQLAELRGRFAREVGSTPPDGRTALLFRLIRESGKGDLPFAKKLAIAQGVLTRPPRATSPGWRTLALSFTLYTASVVAGAFALLVAAFPMTESGAHPEPVVLTPLACLTGVDEGAAAEHSRAIVTGVGVFRTAQEAATAKDRVAVEPRVSVTAFGPAIFVSFDPMRDKAPPVHGSGVSTWTEERTERTELAGRAVQDAGGTFKALPLGGSLDIECRGRDEATARAVEEELNDYFAAAALQVAVRPPWVQPEDALPDTIHRQEQARRTYRLVTERGRTPRDPPSAASLFHAWVDRTSPSDWAVQERERRVRAILTAAEASRATETLDEDVVRLAVARAGANPDDADGIVADLAERLGTLPSGQVKRDGPPMAWDVRRTETRISIQMRALQSRMVQTTLPAMTAWLCEKGCADPKLTMIEHFAR